MLNKCRCLETGAFAPNALLSGPKKSEEASEEFVEARSEVTEQSARHQTAARDSRLANKIRGSQNHRQGGNRQ